MPHRMYAPWITLVEYAERILPEHPTVQRNSAMSAYESVRTEETSKNSLPRELELPEQDAEVRKRPERRHVRPAPGLDDHERGERPEQPQKDRRPEREDVDGNHLAGPDGG